MGVKSRRCLPTDGSVIGRLAVLFIVSAAILAAQPNKYANYSNKLAPYVPSPQPIVERMLELASVKPGETVFDLGGGDLREADLTGADVVVMYLLTGSNEEIRPRLEKFLKPGARVVSYAYAVPGWKPTRVDRTDERHGHTIYLYEMPPAAAK